MSDILGQLHLDHGHVARLLNLLEAQCNALEQESSPDYDLMLDIMYYMTHYPDLFHHPREDLIFARMRQLEPQLAPVLDTLEDEHQQLADQGETLSGLLRQTIDEGRDGDGQLVEGARDYIRLLRDHMEMEEWEVFRLAEAMLKPQDWQAIDRQIDHQEDPLFGSRVRERYHCLYEYVTHPH